MIDEFNSQPYNNDRISEQEKPVEMQTYAGNPSAEEFPAYGEQRTAALPKKAGKIMATLSAAVAALVFTVVLAPAVLPSDVTAVDFAEVWSTDTSIGYFIYLEGSNFENLRVVVYNDFTERSQEVTGEEVSGEATGLKPNMNYKLAVRDGNKTLAETALRTMKTEDMPVTALYSVTHECTCDVDGLFHFTMDFIDENGYWYDFRATLTDAYGNVSECVFTDDLQAEQTVSVTDAELLGESAAFRILCNSYEDGEVAEKILYETIVTI